MTSNTAKTIIVTSALFFGGLGIGAGGIKVNEDAKKAPEEKAQQSGKILAVTLFATSALGILGSGVYVIRQMSKTVKDIRSNMTVGYETYGQNGYSAEKMAEIETANKAHGIGHTVFIHNGKKLGRDPE